MSAKHIPDGKYKLKELTEFYGTGISRLRTILDRAEFNKYRKLVKKGFSQHYVLIEINTISRNNLEFWVNKTQRKRKKDDRTAITTGA